MNYDSRGRDRIYTLLVNSVLFFTSLVVLLPFLYVLASSFASKHEILTRGFFLLPDRWVWDAYGYLLNDRNFTTAFRNAVYITVIGTSINIVLTGLMAYGLSKSWLRGRRALNIMVLLTMIFNGGMIPTYLVVKELHLLNSYWALFLVTAIAPFNLIVLRSFFQSIPQELEESARIDGCSEWRLLAQIIVPLSMPAIATFTLFYAVHNWNTYFNAILYIHDSAKWPLQVFLRQMLLDSDSDMDTEAGGFEFGPHVKMAGVILTALPLLIVYPFLQKYFNKGMLLGSVKG